MAKPETRNRKTRSPKSDRARRLARLQARPSLERLESIQLLSTYTVTSSADTDTSGTLRYEIEAANMSATASEIDFNILTSGYGGIAHTLQTITPAAANPLPTVTVPLFINGFSQGGVSYTGAPKIEIAGTSIGAGYDGITLGAGSEGSHVEGLSIVNFGESTNLGGAGIYIEAGSSVSGSAGNDLIDADYLGVEPDGATGDGNQYGIVVSTSGNTIGGATAPYGGNLISGNAGGGILLVQRINSTTNHFDAVNNNLIQYNVIGTDDTDTTAIANGTGSTVYANFGIGVAGAAGTTIEKNLISGNDGYGIDVTARPSDLTELVPDNAPAQPDSGTLIAGNYIGVDGAGTSATGLGNQAGIVLADAGTATVGGITPAAANVIAGSISGYGGGAVGFGIAVFGSDSAGDVIEGNLIGTDSTGEAAIGLADAGVFVENPAAPDYPGPISFVTTVVGTPSSLTLAGNVIADTGTANDYSFGYDAVDVEGNTGVTSGGDLIQYNIVGGFLNGTGAPNTSGNAGFGIYTDYTPGIVISQNKVEFNNSEGIEVDDSSNVTIGGAEAGQGNIILANTYGIDLEGISTSSLSAGDLIANNDVGVLVNGVGSSATTGNSDVGIFVEYTSGLLIDQNLVEYNDSDGVDVEDSQATTIGGMTIGSGNLISANNGDGIDLYGSPSDTSYGDVVGGNGLGVDFFGNGSIATTGNTDDGIDASYTSGMVFSANVVGFNADDAVDIEDSAGGNTVGGATAALGNFIYANDGNGIILDGTSSISSVGDLIEFNTVGRFMNGNGSAASGNQGDGITADYTTDLQAYANTIEFNTGIGILAEDSSTVTIGSTTAGFGNRVAAEGAVGIGIYGVSGTASDSDVISGNMVGLFEYGNNSAATSGNQGNGINLAYTSNLTVEGNTVEFSAGDGIYNSYSSDDTYAGNAVAKNTGAGIEEAYSSGTYIGVTMTIPGNVITSNGSYGIDLYSTSGTLSDGDSIVGNQIGTNSGGVGSVLTTGNGDVGIVADYTDGLTVQGNTVEYNGDAGIYVDDSTGTTIGGALSAEGNVVAANAGDGVFLAGLSSVSPAVGDLVQNNKIGVLADGTGSVVTTGNLGVGLFATLATMLTVDSNAVEYNGDDGIDVDASDHVTIGDAADGNLVAGNDGEGIYLTGVAPDNLAAGDSISGNIIGEIPDGLSPPIPAGNTGDGLRAEYTTGLTILDNTVVDSSDIGIVVYQSDQTTIGSAELGNIVVGSGSEGIDVYSYYDEATSAYSTGDVIQGNFVGVLPNGDGSAETTGNSYQGIIAEETTGLQVVGNTVRFNGSDGIVSYNELATTIGGTGPGSANVVADNAGTGISIYGYADDNQTDNTIQGNFVGVLGALDTSIDHANQNFGIIVEESTNALIDTNVVVYRTSEFGIFDVDSSGTNITGNVVTGGGTFGVAPAEYFEGSVGILVLYTPNAGGTVARNTVEDGFIGISLQEVDGVTVTGNLVADNASTGVAVYGGDNSFGGSYSGDSNTIRDNGGDGVQVEDFEYYDSSVGGVVVPSYDGSIQGNLISRNLIYGNGGLGINLGEGGTPLSNGSGPGGANNQQDYPVLTAVTVTPTDMAFAGTLTGVPSQSYTVEFFSNPVVDPSGNGQGQTYLGTAIVNTDAAGNATFSLTINGVLAPGYSITATATDQDNNTSEFSLNVPALEMTTTTLDGTPYPSTYGQEVDYTATVAAADLSTMSGTVTFSEGMTVLGTVPLGAGGVAMLPLSLLGVGSHNIVATYNPTGNDASSASVAEPGFVIAAPTATTLSTSANPADFGVSTSFTATVSAQYITPVGSVKFYDGATLLGTVALGDGGVAVYNTSSLASGPHSITATYVPTANFVASTSAAVAETVQVLTATALSSTANPSMYAHPLTLTATVTSPDGTPTGTVSFYADSVLLGTVAVGGDGTASIDGSAPLGRAARDHGDVQPHRLLRHQRRRHAGADGADGDHHVAAGRVDQPGPVRPDGDLLGVRHLGLRPADGHGELQRRRDGHRHRHGRPQRGCDLHDHVPGRRHPRDHGDV